MLSEHSKQLLAERLTHYPPNEKASAVIYACYLAQADSPTHSITQQAAREIAEVLEMDPTEVQGVIGFYSLLFEEPMGKYVIHFCNDLPCALRGADRFYEFVRARLGIEDGETTPDGLFTIEHAMCIGACHRAPCMQVNLEFQEFLTEEKFDRIIELLRAGEPLRANMADAEPLSAAAPL
ncbi:MAG: NAD(P)H-dependent oxidoreductase subunit E [Anaerolineae bacterium]|nr:NAD(P)H-dependent oxidoreductase subunit E [Anaerolineae bacterium]